MPSRSIDLDDEFDVAVEKTTNALAAEGFGVISRIDLDQKFKERLDIDFRRYVILGACNPSMAYQAVRAAPEVGLLLPCNVVVEEIDGGARVRLVDAADMLTVGGLMDIGPIRTLSQDADQRLERVAKALSRG